MAFWNARRSSAPTAVDGSAALGVQPRLEPIQLLTADRRISGWTIALEQRVLDFLSEHPVLRVCVDPQADVWESVARSELLVVAPPPRPQANPRRIHRQKRRVRVVVGPYVVSGAFHVPPGASPDAYLDRTRPPFIALTDAVVGSRDERAGGEWFEVVIVNATSVDELTPLLSLA
jgi:hypothetical protein